MSIHKSYVYIYIYICCGQPRHNIIRQKQTKNNCIRDLTVFCGVFLLSGCFFHVLMCFAARGASSYSQGVWPYVVSNMTCARFRVFTCNFPGLSQPTQVLSWFMEKQPPATVDVVAQRRLAAEAKAKAKAKATVPPGIWRTYVEEARPSLHLPL